MQHSVAQFDQLDKDSKSSIIELCIRAIGQHLTRVSDSSQVGAMVVAAQSIKADGQHNYSVGEYDHSKSQATERCKESWHGQTESL